MLRTVEEIGMGTRLDPGSDGCYPATRTVDAEPLPKALASSKIKLGDQDVECHVLSDERRVLSTSQVQAFLGAAMDRKFARQLSRIPRLSKTLAVRPTIKFVLKGGGVAHGYEGRFVMKVCLAYQASFLGGDLHPSQMDIAKRAMEAVCVYAEAGIEAAIDEATGYQRMRPGDYLQRRVDQFIREYRDEWKPRWSPDAVKAFCKLYRKRYTPNPKFMQPVAGKIYDMLIGSDVMSVVRHRNPVPRKGTNHHQYFRVAVQVQLEKELAVIAGLAETSQSATQFWHRMSVRYLGHPMQMDLFQ